MRRGLKRLMSLAALAGLGIVMSACADTKALNRDMQDADDFGHAVREDLAAQIVNPEPTWKGPLPPSSGARAALAQNLYRKDTVKTPITPSTQTSITPTGDSGSTGGGGASASGGSSN